MLHLCGMKGFLASQPFRSWRVEMISILNEIEFLARAGNTTRVSGCQFRTENYVHR